MKVIKKKLISTLLLPVLCLGAIPLSFAASSEKIGLGPVELTLEETLKRVRDTHPGLKEQELAVMRAREEVALATRAFIPDVDLDYIASLAGGGIGLIVTASKLLKPVFSPKSLLAERDAKKMLKEKEEADLKVRELEISYHVKELFIMLLLQDRKSTRLNSSHSAKSRMPSSA